MSAEAVPSLDASGVLEQHERWLRAVLYARLRCADAVDEVLQEVALATVSQAARAQEIGRIGPWLYRVAIRQVLLYRRKMGRRRKLVQKFTEAVPATDVAPVRQSDPLQWLLRVERQQAVQRGLEQLSSRDREMLLLKYSEGYSYEEIAGQLGLSASAVQARLHRARGRLRELLLAAENDL